MNMTFHMEKLIHETCCETYQIFKYCVNANADAMLESILIVQYLNRHYPLFKAINDNFHQRNYDAILKHINIVLIEMNLSTS